MLLDPNQLARQIAIETNLANLLLAHSTSIYTIQNSGRSATVSSRGKYLFTGLFEDLDLEIFEFDDHAGVVELELDHAGVQATLLLEVLGELR